MTPEEKAYELVDKFFMPLPWTNEVIIDDYDDWEVAKKSALILVKEILSIKNLPKEEILFYKKVKLALKNL
jgi:hypothetical protein